MATENLREKLNLLANMIQSEDLQMFQAQLIVDAAAESTGDAQVDQAMAGNATNCRAQILGNTRRLAVYRAKYTELKTELDAAGAA